MEEIEKKICHFNSDKICNKAPPDPKTYLNFLSSEKFIRREISPICAIIFFIFPVFCPARLTLFSYKNEPFLNFLWEN